MTRKCVAAFFFTFPLLACIINAGQVVFDITTYGAKPDADISEALTKAWTDAVASVEPAKIVIPTGTWKLSQAKLCGTGHKSPIEFNLQGTMVAPAGDLPDKNSEWITINYVDGFEISGGGVLDGQGGQIAWKKNDYADGVKSTCGKMPINLSLNFIKNAFIHDVTVKDSKNFQVNCISSTNVTFQHFTISAPGDAPNTDGIHIARGTGIKVLDSTIETGDDCISIGDDSHDFHIENVKCGPGHGISIGSLGKYPDEKDVSGITVKGCTFTGTQNGIRIKSWPSTPGKLSVTDLHFEDLTMDNVSQPIIFDQEYCPSNLCKLDSPSQVKISKVSIKNIKGTSFTQDAVVLICSSANPCAEVELADIDLSLTGTLGTVSSKCKNIKPTVSGKQNPPICVESGAAPAAAA